MTFSSNLHRRPFTTRTSKPAARTMRTSNQAIEIESETKPATYDTFGKIPCAYQRSTSRAGKTAAHEAMKVRRPRRGKTQANRAPDAAVKICKIPVLGLTIRLAVCYDAHLSFNRLIAIKSFFFKYLSEFYRDFGPLGKLGYQE